MKYAFSSDVPSRHLPRTVILVVAGLLLGLLLGACGDGKRRAAQPTPNVTTFEPGRFDDIPLFPRSEPLGPRSEKDGVVARSYMAKGTTPQQVLEYYRTSLNERWRLVSPIEKLGVGTYRADWVSDQYRLRVSATEAPSVELDDASKNVIVQYSLTLTPLVADSAP